VDHKGEIDKKEEYLREAFEAGRALARVLVEEEREQAEQNL
jgi:hypothetical protein